MEISLLLMQQIAELFLMILMGYMIVKAGLLKGEDSKVISKIVLYLIIPCVIINAFQVDYTSEKVQGLLLAFAASVMLQVVLLVIVWTAGRLMGLNEVEKASVYYSNAGNLIMPIVTFVLGQEWVLYGCVFMSVQLVFVWSHGKSVLSMEKGIDWRKIIFNINMIAVFAGVVLFFTKIRLPQIVNHTLGSVGSMIGPGTSKHDRNGHADRRNELKKYFYQWKDLFYYVYTSGGCSDDCIAAVKGQRTCKWQSGWKEDFADRISGSDHALCFNSYPDVPGIWK